MNNKYKGAIIGIIIVDILSIINLIYQIVIKDVSYMSLITIVMCNIIVFAVSKKKSN